VQLGETLRWFAPGALAGRRVLVTRTRLQASELARALAEHGAEPIELPAIEIIETADATEVTEAIDALRSSAYRWCVFTSQNAVDIFVRHLREAGHDVRAFGRTSIAAIGPGTDAALARHGLRADVVPERFVAEGLIDALASRVMRGQRVLVPRADGARDALIDNLRERGALVDELVLYRAAIPRDPDAEGLRLLRAGAIDTATFASSSAVRNLIAMLDGDVSPLRDVCIAVIGPVTAQAVRDAGLRVYVEASTYTVPGLVEALLTHAEAAAAKE
jgi:uroporphyrinogen III methyltransferase/synthase